jgi:hypothetical protein
MKTIDTGLSNYYGTVMAYEENGKYYIGLDDYSAMSTIEISENLFKEIENEFSS